MPSGKRKPLERRVNKIIKPGEKMVYDGKTYTTKGNNKKGKLVLKGRFFFFFIDLEKVHRITMNKETFAKVTGLWGRKKGQKSENVGRLDGQKIDEKTTHINDIKLLDASYTNVENYTPKKKLGKVTYTISKQIGAVGGTVLAKKFLNSTTKEHVGTYHDHPTSDRISGRILKGGDVGEFRELQKTNQAQHLNIHLINVGKDPIPTKRYGGLVGYHINNAGKIKKALIHVIKKDKT